METLKFKSTIKCAGCISTVTPFLNEAVGKDQWEVDLTSSDRVLTVHGENATEAKVQEALNKAGYSIEKL